MKKVTQYIVFLFALCMFIPLGIHAESTVCTFEKGLTITFDDNGNSSINQDFYDVINKDWLVYQKYAGDNISRSEDIKYQISSLRGSCPSKVYYCKLEVVKINSPLEVGETIENLTRSIIDSFTKKSFSIDIVTNYLRVFIPSITSDKKVLLYNSNADAKGEHLGLDLESDEWNKGFGFEVIDAAQAVINNSNSETWARLVQSIGELVLGGPIAKIYWTTKDCDYANYTGDLPTYNLACTYTRGYLNDYDQFAKDYKSCKDNPSCKSNAITKLNEKETELKKYCNNILKNYNYDGDVEQDCIDSCLIISDNIKAMRKDVGLDSVTNGKCGFSARLGVWALNIMKWVKYILPVIVIILGILDFIKAIGADKEDEMKKSQKKFITRLIAAALVFIVPFIIEFALDKFGFTEYIDGCGIIKEI